MDLVRRAQRGDLDAFDQLVDRYAPDLYRLAVAVIGQEVAADATQDALVRAWRELPSLRDPDRFAPWIRRVLVNRCRDIARAQRRRPREIRVEMLDRDDQPVAPGPAEVVDRRADLERALARLSVDQRTVLALCYFAGLPLTEIARTLGVPEGTAKSRLNAALVALRRTMTEVTR